MKISFDKNYYLFSNLTINKTEVLTNTKNVYLSGSDINDVKIDLLIDENYRNLKILITKLKLIFLKYLQ